MSPRNNVSPHNNYSVSPRNNDMTRSSRTDNSKIFTIVCYLYILLTERKFNVEKDEAPLMGRVAFCKFSLHRMYRSMRNASSFVLRDGKLGIKLLYLNSQKIRFMFE